MYRRMEVNHPSPKMRRQAEHLRFILEAPKLQRSPDEKVKIPILKDIERKCGTCRYAQPKLLVLCCAYNRLKASRAPAGYGQLCKCLEAS